MSIAHDLIIILSNYPEGYRLMRARARGDMTFEIATRKKLLPQNTSLESVRVTLSRLKKRGLVSNDNGSWILAEGGRKYLAQIFDRQGREKLRQKPKAVIIAFDIPEIHKTKRHWLRTELIGMGFEMLQKSLWFGPSPLTKDFIHTLGELNLLRYIKFFKAEQYDIV